MSLLSNNASIKDANTHKQKITALYALLNSNFRSFNSATIHKLNDNAKKVTLKMSQHDLKRNIDLSSKATYLLNKNKSTLLDVVPTEPQAGKLLLVESYEPQYGEISVRFRKGDDPNTGDKDLFIEVWKAGRGFVSSMKVSDKLSKVYNDDKFGGISWSRDCKKIVFIGEVPPPAKYNSFFIDE